MLIKDIMTKNVAYIDPQSAVIEAAQLMQKHNVGSIPVCDRSGVIGIVTDRDIVVRNVAHGTDPRSLKVQDVMTSGVATVSPDMDVDEAGRIMARNQVRRLPVVENHMLVGMVALGDLAVNARYDTEASKALTEISIPAKPEAMPKK